MPAPTRDQVDARLAQLFGSLPAEESPVERAILVARALQERSHDLQTPAERRQQAELDRMIHNPHDKATLTQMTDQAFRSQEAQRSADQFIHILDVQGVPRFFNPLDRTLLKGFQSFGAYLPGVAMPLVKEKMQQETANVILPAEPEHLKKHLDERRAEGVRMNVNHLGESLLGEEDAQRRLEGYLAVLQRPEIEVISVKISTIYSQISALARRHTVSVLCDRMELLYRAAMRGKFRRADGTEVPKFVYLDMEEYRDMHLTAEVFMQTLARKGLEGVAAGIALQAYIPDSFLVMQTLCEFARKRVAAGGAPITIRLVKGANMEMERVEASLEGWPQAPYKEKIDTDANYHRMLGYAMQPENRDAVRLGIASHNLFTLAYGLVMAADAGVLDRVQFEMLEGMANHQRRALFELVRNLLLYAPACRQEEFINAIGYLVRRLDENTGPDNFLRHAFNVKVGSEDWNRLEQQFRDSFARMGSVSSEPRRQQNRALDASAEGDPARPKQSPGDAFANEPNTDFSLVHNSTWAEELVAECKARDTEPVPLVIAGETIWDDRPAGESVDPSRPEKLAAKFLGATADDAKRAIDTAVEDPDGWRRMSPRERSERLYAVAEEIARARGELLGVMMGEGGKLIPESDPEVSEAIDFCRFYAHTAEEFYGLAGLRAAGKGVAVVVSPWNFPLAIPCGGIAASLAAGNTVVFKPASDTALVGYRLCECFWRAGVPKSALQFVTSLGEETAQALVTHRDVKAVVFTGGTSTAAHLLKVNPAMPLFAETGGKNATIVTAMSDRDLAVKNVVQSAFGHGGQKCSATSLLLLEDEVYHDQGFRQVLCDAVESLRIGSAWDLATKMGPLILPPSGALEQGLKELERGESWAVMPRLGVEGNPHLVSPGVKWNVEPDSATHLTEFFGPLLGVMCFRTLSEAIDIVNRTGYGLTSGLESLDDREQVVWRNSLRAGNLYINRSTTGAIVLRQPFGGMGKSNVGPGIKAGGPNYVAQLMEFTAEPHDERGAATVRPRDRQLADLLDWFPSAELAHTLASYEFWAHEEFLQEHDHFRLLGEDNIRRYRPVEVIRVRVDGDDTPWEVLARVAAARSVGCRVVVSTPPGLRSELDDLVTRLDEQTEAWAASIEFVEESDVQLAREIAQHHAGRIRYAHPARVPETVRVAAAEALDWVADVAVSPHGRVELLWYLREQSVSYRYHRYGNLGFRGEETRDEPA